VDALRFEAIATVYAWAPQARLPHPMLALRTTAVAPAQFVFDRGQLGGPSGLLAFVVSASDGSRDALQAAVLAQGQAELAALGVRLQAVQTVVEKHATFACTARLVRPPQTIAPGLGGRGRLCARPLPSHAGRCGAQRMGCR
jgi:hypothetical protein